MQGGLTRGGVPNPEEQIEKLRKVVGRQKKALQRKDRQIEEQAAKLENLREKRQHESKLKRELKQQGLKIFHLENELDAMNSLVETNREIPAAEEAKETPGVGALPDFVIIGAQKGGTSFLY